MVKLIENNPISIIIALVLIMLGMSFQYLDITIMEARNFITAREMIYDGNWILTTMNGEPRYQKPPMPTWFAAISGGLFGIHDLFALRFPGIIMLVIIGLTAFGFSKNFLEDKLHALINSLITITSFYIIAIIIEGPWDIFAHGFMYLAIYLLYNFFQKSANDWKNSILAGLFIGFSLLCKGPVSFYALLLPFLISYGIVYSFKSLKSKSLPIIFLVLIALLIGGWWYLYVRIEDAETFIKITTKETGNWSNYNVRPFYYYWSFFSQSGLWTIPAFISLLYPYLKKRVNNLKAYQFTLLWTLISVFLLSVIPEKKSRYLMPVLIPLALNTGFYLIYIIRRFSTLRLKERIPVYINFGIIGIIGVVFPMLGYVYLRTVATFNSWILFAIPAVVLFIIGLSILINLKRKRLLAVFYFTISFMVTAFALASPLIIRIKPENYKILGINNIAKERDINVYALQHVSPEIIWHFDNQLKRIKINDSTYQFPNEGTFGILVQNKLSLEDEKQLLKEYILQKLDRFDLNISTPDSKRYRNRLSYDFYVLTRKNFR